MKILLVTLDSKYIHANLAVRYLKKYCKDLENEKISIEIKEFTINQKQEYILNEIFMANADLICFSSYIWNIEYVKELSYILKEAKNNIKILCGGPEVSFEIEKFMQKEEYIDFVIFGEGEETFRQFIIEFSKSKPNYKNIDGLVYKHNNEIIINKERQPIMCLDKINYPYDEDDDFQDKIIYYESSRGCPFSCSFCMSSIDKQMRVLSLDRVRADLTLLLKTKARQIKFVDRTFNADYKRAIEIMDFIIENNINNMTIHFEITADIINLEFLEYINKLPVNMFQFEIGVQSLNEKTLIEINRHMDKDKLNMIIKGIKQGQNVHIHLDLIAGLPYEDYSSFKSSFDGIHQLQADKIQLGFLKVLKGTKIYNDKERHEIKYRKTAPYEVICTKYIAADKILKLKNIEELVDKYYNEKYFQKSLEFILTKFFKDSAFEFYEDLSNYYQENDLYRVSHSRKKLYKILYEYITNMNCMSDEFIDSLRYDYVYNNQYEDLPDYLNKQAEDKHKIIKRTLANDESFKKRFFPNAIKASEIINDFRIVDIGLNTILFIYKDKNNIFNRCTTYLINDFLGEMLNE